MVAAPYITLSLTDGIAAAGLTERFSRDPSTKTQKSFVYDPTNARMGTFDTAEEALQYVALLNENRERIVCSCSGRPRVGVDCDCNRYWSTSTND